MPILDELACLKKGRSAVYHRGFLARDRGLAPLSPHGKDYKRTIAEQRVHEVAQYAERLCEAGMVTLTQRRVGEGEFEYIAQGLRPEPRGA
jgi:hypothetical protein